MLRLIEVAPAEFQRRCRVIPQGPIEIQRIKSVLTRLGKIVLLRLQPRQTQAGIRIKCFRKSLAYK